MNRKFRNSLIFGAAVGGLFAAARNAERKQQLTDDQSHAINEVKRIFERLQGSLSKDLSLTPIYVKIKEFEPAGQYKDIIAYLENEIQKDAESLGLTKNLKSKLQYVLSGRFTEQRNNANSHKSQSFFLQIKELPDILLTLLEKRTQISRLMQKVFRYIDAGESTDFKPADSAYLQTYVSEFKALDKQAEILLSEFRLL